MHTYNVCVCSVVGASSGGGGHRQEYEMANARGFFSAPPSSCFFCLSVCGAFLLNYVLWRGQGPFLQPAVHFLPSSTFITIVDDSRKCYTREIVAFHPHLRYCSSNRIDREGVSIYILRDAASRSGRSLSLCVCVCGDVLRILYVPCCAIWLVGFLRVTCG